MLSQALGAVSDDEASLLSDKEIHSRSEECLRLLLNWQELLQRPTLLVKTSERESLDAADSDDGISEGE